MPLARACRGEHRTRKKAIIAHIMRGRTTTLLIKLRAGYGLPRVWPLFGFGAAVWGALLGSTASTRAGGFDEPVQSVVGQGTSNAGVAAGGSLSSMFWNPATLTQSRPFATELGATGILPHISQQGNSSVLPLGSAFGFTAGVDNSALNALVPMAYVSRQISDRVWLGLSINAPFGLSDKFPNTGWAGAFYGQNASFNTYNATPSVAVKLNDWISVGAGVQAQYAHADLTFASGVLGPANPALAQISAKGWGWGWTAGITLTPASGTHIGLGYRSAIDQKFDGSLSIEGGLSTPGSVATTVKLPDSLTLGVRQALSPQLSLLGAAAWTNWSRIGTSNFYQPGGAPALSPSGASISIPFQYRDGWFYAVGLEYILNPTWTLRSGVAYETSPITDQVRVPLIPDTNRTWVSIGATATISKNLRIDLAYSYIHLNSTAINVTTGNPSFNGIVAYEGTANTHVNVVSLAVRYLFDYSSSATHFSRAPILTKD
jgi:long-chain fatty acid transport protein